MRGIKSSIYLVNTRVQNTFEKLMNNDMAFGLMLGANHAETGVYGAEMMGFITAIQDAQEDCLLPLIQALDCCGVNATTAQDDDDTVYNMISFFMDRLQSGYYGADEPITVLINSEGYKQITLLRGAIERALGQNVLVVQNADSYDGCRDYKNLRVMSFAFEGGQYVDFVQFLPFDVMYPMGTESVMIAMPKNMISMYQKMVTGLDDKLNVELSTP